MEKIKRVSVYLWIFILVVADQIIKLVVSTNIKNSSITIIKGFLRFWYCENQGVAFSFGNGHVPVFIVINLLMIGGLIFYYEKNKNKFYLYDKMFFIMVIAGGISNLIDRVFRGYVIDFIDVSELFNFAVFNVADIFIVCGIIGLVFSIMIKEIKVAKS